MEAAQQLIRSLPSVVSQLALREVAESCGVAQGASLVVGGRNYFPEDRNLHAFLDQKTDVVRCSEVPIVLQTVGAIVVGVVHLEYTCVVVHFLQEVPHRLVS